MHLPFTTLDVFTSTPYLGNPLAVIRVPSSLRSVLTEAQKQRIAREFNYSEITFLHEPTGEDGIADFDIFTPLSRMTFAGHPTIGTSVYIATHAQQYLGIKALRTIAGVIPLQFDEKNERVEVAIPHNVHIHSTRRPHPFPSPSTNSSGSDTVPIVSIVPGMAFHLIPMKDLEALALPSSGLLAISELYKHEHLDKGTEWDLGYTGTFFYVDLGVENGIKRLRTRGLGAREDPGTGSASADLCAYLALVESGEVGGKEFNYHLTQGVEMGRQCDIFVRVVVREDGKGIEGVWLSGGAVEVMEGTLRVQEEGEGEL
ncbi:phenazine biosynthesis protein-like protein phzf family [Amniculicola lignicola CBS 123094]|uniref:Phenazine biosynthesis protein-like protein phzf family n=1 Tax=Amniculicola lignicola CBS 123094 TaxID=1392246 RepID=A0A6A5WKS1_9PLEO|nr:phenazine biosynthesis protein-like protein phzf family [Amniculicola lignicola CBS 123094]